MSLLGTQVYANPSTSCWVSRGGDTIEGNLDVTGIVEAQQLVARSEIDALDGNGNTLLRMTNAFGSSYIQVPTDLKIGQIGQGTTNVTFTIGTPGQNDDVIALGGEVIVYSLTSSTCAGTGSIAANTTTVTIACDVVQAASKIFLSHKGLGVAAPAFGPAQNSLTYGNIVPGVSFDVEINDVLGNPIPAAPGGPAVTFDWLVIN